MMPEPDDVETIKNEIVNELTRGYNNFNYASFCALKDIMLTEKFKKQLNKCTKRFKKQFKRCTNMYLYS